MSTPRRERLIELAARALLWSDAQQYERDAARRRARSVVDAILEAPNDGHAAERALKVVERDVA